MNEEINTLAKSLDAWFHRYAELAAVHHHEKKLYKDLDKTSRNIARFLNEEHKKEPLIGVYATKELFTFECIAGIIRAGKAFVPLSPLLRVEKIHEIIKQSGIKTIFGDPFAHKDLSKIDLGAEIRVMRPGSNYYEGKGDYSPALISANNAAYVFYTSGSTGQPKGVQISHSNILSYLKNIGKFIKVEAGDHCSQTFGLSFDLSIHDIFFTWQNGGCVCIPKENDLLSPSSYIKQNNIQHFFAVPSLAGLMNKLRQLNENNFPGIKNVLFCGEGLPSDIAEKFMRAAPNAVFHNLYGPTEATVAIAAHTIEKDIKQKNGIVCIGKIFEGNNFLVHGENENATHGELWVSGTQVIKKYFNNTEADKESFYLDENGITWYKTGDIVTCDKENNLFYLGRKDTQVKLSGYRVELAEIESVIKSVGDYSNVICFVKEEKGAKILVAAIEGAQKVKTSVLLNNCLAKLPVYMIPQQIVYLPEFPLNVNGKVDRKAITQTIIHP